MKFGYIKTALCSPKIKVADVEFNTNAIIEAIDKAEQNGAELIVFPQLSLTASTCFNLFNSNVLLDGALKGLGQICQKSQSVNALIFVGAPIKHNNRVYNTAVAICGGKILGVVPQAYSFEGYNFAKCPSENTEICILGANVPFGNKIIFKKGDNALYSIACELGEDMLSPVNPSSLHALAGANIVVNLSAFCETVGAEQFRLETVKAISEKLVCGYCLCNASEGESTTDCVYGGQKIIAEKGAIIKDCSIFSDDMIISEIDAGFIANERANLFKNFPMANGYQTIEFNFEEKEQNITRSYQKTPFAPKDVDLEQRAEKILLK
jgi:NAD+ synthase (glutamine-hydrolysing)